LEDSDRHAVTLGELVEWWQDLTQQAINSRAVLLPVPSRWGRTHLLDEFAAVVDDDEAVSIVVRVPGASLPDGLGLQALALQDLFSEARVEHRAAELLGVDRLGGVIQLGLGVAGLFAAPLAALVGLLLAGVGVGAVSRVWDNSPAGQEGAVARLARAVAAVSESVHVVVIIDDADRLETDLAVVLVENLIERADGHVLVVAAVNPSGDLASALVARAAYGLTEGRIRTVNVDPDMGDQARRELAAELCPNLPTAAIRRIGQRTRTFAEVFAVAASGRLAEMDAHGGDAAAVTVVDEVIDAQVNRAPPSAQAVALAWAGGLLHARQAERAIEVLGKRPLSDDVIRFESLVRLADPASPRLAEQVHGLSAIQRHQLAQAVVDTAAEIGADPEAGLVEKVVAWQAVHRVRTDLQDRAPLLAMQGQLVHSLEDLGDSATAYQVARTALADYIPGRTGQQRTPEQEDLSAAVLRLARAQQPTQADPLISATIDAVETGDAAIGLEARIWAAIDLLGQPDQRDRALELTNQITTELGQRTNLGAVGNRWRLQLAFHAGRAGIPAITQQLLAPMLDTPAAPEDEDAARAVLYAVGGPQADTRLQIIGLEAELAALPSDADDELLRVHHALAADFARLGDYRRALHHAQEEFPLRDHLQGRDHPDTLRTRYNIALWTGYSGGPAASLPLFQELLPELERVFGPDHFATLSTRNNIAAATGYSGNPAEALRLFQELLPDYKRVLGPYHTDTLTVSNNVAYWTGKCGNAAEALRMFQGLLSERVQVLGWNHPDTLTVRNNIAAWTGECGDPAEALRLLQELLPDRVRVQGQDHPDTLRTRNDIAFWTEKSGYQAEAVRLYEDVLRDRERVLGSDHPDTLDTRRRIQQLETRGQSPDGSG
jgi:hypothetical protein